MEDVLTAFGNEDFYRALVLLWRQFQSNHPLFLDAERSAHDNPQQYQQTVREVLDGLRQNKRLPLRSLLKNHPLAVLSALDEFISETLSLQDETLSTPIHIGNEGYFVHKRCLARSAGAAHTHKGGHLQTWLRCHWIIPEKLAGGYVVEMKHAPDRVNRRCENALTRGNLKIYVGNFPDQVTPLWLDQNPAAWLALDLTEPEKRWQSVLQALADAEENPVDILVLPELTLPPALRQRVSEWLDDTDENPFALVLPGTFHAKVGERIYNEAVLFDHRGKPVLTHRKLTYLRFEEKDEKITPGNAIQLLNTPIGLLAMPICLDFCEEGRPFSDLWEQLGVEWLLIPAFGGEKSVHAHQRKAETMARAHATVSVLANQHPNGEDQDHGFVHHNELVSTNISRCVTVTITKSKV